MRSIGLGLFVLALSSLPGACSGTKTGETPSPVGGTDKLTKLAWGTLLVLCGALFLDALDVSMMGVALPSIRADLNMSTSSLQWVVSA